MLDRLHIIDLFPQSFLEITNVLERLKLTKKAEASSKCELPRT